MGSEKGRVIAFAGAATMMILLSWVTLMVVASSIDCTTVTTLIDTCSNFITYGSPDPMPGTPCCDAVMGLNNLAETGNNRQSVCGCLMDLITTYNPNASAIATLPGLCGISLGFTIHPNTDCNFIH